MEQNYQPSYMQVVKICHVFFNYHNDWKYHLKVWVTVFKETKDSVWLHFLTGLTLF